MSIEAIEREITTWDDATLRRLAAIVLRLRHERDPAWKADLARKIDDRTEGRWLDLKAAEQELDARRASRGE
jgi:hypothetical protein